MQNLLKVFFLLKVLLLFADVGFSGDNILNSVHDSRENHCYYNELHFTDILLLETHLLREFSNSQEIHKNILISTFIFWEIKMNILKRA